MENQFANLPDSLSEELVEALAESKSVRIERIVFTGHSRPDDFWYDQDEDELIIVMKGEAKLLFDGGDQPKLMQLGDFINIPVRQKHRVECTTPFEPTIWLAIVYRNTK